jgi:hypothetical protein
MSLPPRRPWLVPSIALGLALVIGCDQPTGSTRPRSRNRAAAPAVEQPAPPPQPVEAPRQFIVGKTTQDVHDLEASKKAGGVVVQPKITAKDPITLQGNAYVSIIGQSSMLQIQHAMDLYQADNNGEYPKTKEEFMEKIINPGIRLPQLPAYQEYGYDAAAHKLVIIEYPDRK